MIVQKENVFPFPISHSCNNQQDIILGLSRFLLNEGNNKRKETHVDVDWMEHTVARTMDFLFP